LDYLINPENRAVENKNILGETKLRVAAEFLCNVNMNKNIS